MPPTRPTVAALLAATPPHSVAVGGHRGLGQNPLPSPIGKGAAAGATAPAVAPPLPVPSHRENTVASLVAAAAAGASFVEVDAQVTADGVAVLWHDDAVLVTGPRGPVALPVAALTLAEFRALNRTPGGGLAPPSLSSSDAEGWASDGHRLLRTVRGAPPPPPIPRTRRRAAPGGATAPWAVAADDALPTLAEALAALPPGLGINVEVKASSLAGVGGAEAGGRAVRAEAARVVDGVLAGVAGAGGATGRPLLFSSFDARLAGALRGGQGEWAVFLLAEEASPAVGLAAARLGLQGVVVDAASLLAGGRGGGGGGADPAAPAPTVSPAAVAALTRPPGARLRLATYGAVNDSPSVVAALVGAGVEAVIVDDVGGVVGGLRAG